MPPYLTPSEICGGAKTHPSVSGRRAGTTAVITEHSVEDLNKVSKQSCSHYRRYMQDKVKFPPDMNSNTNPDSNPYICTLISIIITHV